MFICEITIIITILICRKLESVGVTQQKIKLHSPNGSRNMLGNTGWEGFLFSNAAKTVHMG